MQPLEGHDGVLEIGLAHGAENQVVQTLLLEIVHGAGCVFQEGQGGGNEGVEGLSALVQADIAPNAVEEGDAQLLLQAAQAGA